MNIKVCIGSSCHLKGSYEIVELLKKTIKDNGYDADITLSGCFCLDKCSHNGVSVKVDDEVVIGVTRESFSKFMEEKVLPKIK